MSKGAFGGYNKPSFGVKNLTSDMWEPITTTDNFSAYTPEKPAEAKINTQSTRRSVPEKNQPDPARKTEQVRRQPRQRTDTADKTSDKNKKSVARQKAGSSSVNRQRTQERPISSGRVQQKKKDRSKAPSKRQLNLREKRRQRMNLAYVKLLRKGKTQDEARVILTRRKIRIKRIKTFGTVVFFFIFAMSFLMSYSYYQGAEIAEIVIDGDEVYTDEEILSAAGLKTGMNMLTVREKKVNGDVTTALPFISQIGVDYRLPDTLALNVTSTKEQLILKCEKKYICVDKTGKVVSDKKKKLTQGMFLVQGMSEQEYTVGESFSVSEENAERYKIACEFAKATENADVLNYGVLNLEDLKDITFTYRSKICLYLGDSNNLEQKLDSAIKIMESSDIGDKTGYINLKYDIGAYFMEGSMK